MPQASTLQACRALFKLLQALCCCSLDHFRGQDSTRTSSSDSSIKHTAQGYNQTCSMRADCWIGDDSCKSGEAVPCPHQDEDGWTAHTCQLSPPGLLYRTPSGSLFAALLPPKAATSSQNIEGHIARLYIQVALCSLQRERASLHFIQGQALHPSVV